MHLILKEPLAVMLEAKCVAVKLVESTRRATTKLPLGQRLRKDLSKQADIANRHHKGVIVYVCTLAPRGGHVDPHVGQLLAAFCNR